MMPTYHIVNHRIVVDKIVAVYPFGTIPEPPDVMKYLR